MKNGGNAKKVSIWCALALAFLVICGGVVALIVIPSSADSEITGHGLANDPYVIYTPAQWGQVMTHQWAQAEDTIYVKLGGDIIAQNGSFGSGTGYYSGGALHVPANKKVSLDLGTYKIDRGLTSAKSYGSVIINEGYLIINGDAQLHETADAAWNSNYSQATGVTVTGGMITGGYNSTSGYGAGISVRKGTVVMNGGAVCNNQSRGSSMEATGVGINIGTDANSPTTVVGNLIMNNGIVALNTGWGGSLDGGGIGVSGNGHLEMYDGEISWNSTINDESNWGGGMASRNTSILEGGRIRHNYSAGRGGGLAPHIASLSINNIEVSDNIGVREAAIYMGGATLALSNVSITGNKSLSKGYNAINILPWGNTSAGQQKLELSGKIILQNNYNVPDNKKISFYLQSGYVAHITGKITDDSDIYLEMAKLGTFTSGFAANSPGTDPGVFSSNLTGYIVAPTANGQELEIRASSGNADDWNSVVKRSMNEHSVTDFTLTKGWTTSSSDGSLGSGRGFGVKPYAMATTGYDNLRVPEGANVNLTIPTGQILSRNLITAKDNGYIVKVFGRLTIGGGGTITNGNNTGNGGAIYIANGGVLTLKDITIRQNTALSGGAIYVQAGGTLILDGTVIDQNKALTDGGGIYVEAGATVILQNETAVMNNLSRNYTDNLFIAQDGRLTIYSNLAAGSDNSYIGVTMENGIGAFANQTAATNLSRFVPDSDFYMVILQDKVPYVVTKESQTNSYKWNQAVMLSQQQQTNVRFDLLSDWVAENGSFGSGVGFTEDGRLFVPNGASILLHIVEGVTLDRALSTAIVNGNVIQVHGTLTINGSGTITGGNNLDNGGGVYSAGTLNLEGCTISGNHATQGGGIYSTGTLNLQGGTITENTADIGGGIYADNGFYLQGGTVTQNTAATGAGVYIVAASGVNKVNGEIKIFANRNNTNQPSNLVFSDAQKINFTGAVTNNSVIWITPRDETPIITNNFSQAQTSPTMLFICDNNEYALLSENGEVRTVLATDLQVRKPQSTVLIYNGQEQVAITDFAIGQLNCTLPTGVTYRDGELLVTRVGTYTFTVTPRDGYIWEIIDGIGGGNQAVAVTIEVKPIVANDIIWRIDGEETDRIEYTGKAHTVTAWLVTEDSELEISELLIGDVTGTLLGEYSVTLNAGATGSIDFSNQSLTFTWRVYKTQATVHFLIDGEDKSETEYTGESQRVTAYLITDGGKIVENVSVTRETAATSLGHYQAEVGSSTLANFTITNDIVFKWSIVAKKLTFEWSLALNGGAELFPDTDNQVVYNGVEQHAELTLVGVAVGERVTAILTNNIGTDVGEYATRVTGLTGLHAGNYTCDMSTVYNWAIVPQGGIVVTVDWAWSNATYYVGETLMAAALAPTTARAGATTDELAGTITLLTENSKLLLTQPNQSVEVKFTPTNPAYSPVRTTLTVPSKWVEVKFYANDGSGGQITRQYTYNDAVVYVDAITGDSKLKREFYNHVGWSTTPMDALTDAELNDIDLLKLDGDTLATADVTYYAVWCYTTYTIRFYTNNPQQYTTLSNAPAVTETMTWADTTSDQFTQANHGSITYDAAASCYVYEYNHADWVAKSMGDLWFTGIQWNTNAGFKFTYWAGANGERYDKISSIQNLNLYAQWTGRNYTIHYIDMLDADAGTEVGTSIITNGAVMTDAATVGAHDGWNFAGWFVDLAAASDPDNNGGKRVILGETLIWTQSDLSLYAGWTRKKVVVELPKTTGLNIIVQAQEIDPETHAATEKNLTSGDYLYVGTTLTIKVIAEAGYKFTGLQISVLGETETHGAEELELTYVIGDYDNDEPRIPLTISGTCEVITYEIVYDHTETVWNFVDDYQAPTAYDIKSNVILPLGDKVIRSGYTFTGWATVDGNVLTNTQGQLGTLTLYPQWSADAQTIVLYKGGQAVQTITAVTGSAYQLPDWSHEASFNDFVFQGWSEQANLTEPKTGTYTVKPGVNNLYAVWAIKTGTLQLQLSTNNATYNFGEPVLTVTAKSSWTYTDTQHGLSLSYVFTNITTQNSVTSSDGKLMLGQVAESGRYYCELTLTAPGYAPAVTIQSAEQDIIIKGRNLADATYAPMVAVTYTGSAQNPALPRVTLDNVTLLAGVDFNYEYTQNTAVGMAHLVITGQGNFTGMADKESFAINPAELSVLAEHYTGVYDGANHAAIIAQEAISVDGAPTVWSYKAEGASEYTTTMPMYTNASTYTVYYRVTCENHEPFEASVKVKIDPYQTAVVWGTTTFTYDRRTHEPTATMTDINGAELNLNISSARPKNAGTYTATASTSNQNYYLTGASTEFVITPRKITATITANGGQREEETIKYTEAKLNDLANGDNPEITYTYENEATQEVVLENNGLPKQAGTYLVTVSITDPNYELTGLTQVYFLIRDAGEIIVNAVTVQRDNWVYGDTPSSLVFSALDGVDDAQITYFRIINGDAATGERVEIDEALLTAKLNVGLYVVTVYIPEIQIGDDGHGRTAASNECVFQVLPRELGITWHEAEYEYDGEQHKPDVTLSNVLADDDCVVTVSVAADAGITVGRYLATAGTPSNANYALPNVFTYEYAIRPRQIKVIILDQISAYGDELNTLIGETADGAICGLDNADGSVYTLVKEAGLNVGTYQITGTSTNPNYKVTFKNATETRNYGQYVITPQVANVIWEQASNYLYTGTEQVIRAYIIDKYTKQEIDLEVSNYRNAATQAGAFKLAGDYRLEARETSRNYALTGATTTATIERAPLTIAADDTTVRYGEVFTLTATMTGFVGDDDVSVLQGGRITTDYKLNGDITEQDTYTINASDYQSENYAITYVAGTLTVQGIYLKVQINDQTSVYGNSILAPSFTFLGETIMNPSQVFVIEKEAGTTVGEYKLTGRILNRNYGVEFVNENRREYAVYTIMPRPITVKIFDKQSAYASALVELEAKVAYDAVIGLDNADGSVYTLSKEDGDIVGEYQIIGTSTNENYAVTFKSVDADRDYGVYFITPTATFTQERVYNGEEQDAIMLKTPTDKPKYTWEFSTEGEIYTTEMPRYRKPGTYNVSYRITAENGEEYQGEIQLQISKAQLTVVISENKVEKGKNAVLNEFNVLGLGTGDDKMSVIELVYTEQPYDAETAAVGDSFALEAVLREEYADCYDLVTVEPNTLTVVEPGTNVGLIIGILLGVGVVCGGAAVAVVMVIKKKHGKGPRVEGKTKTKEGK